MSRSSSQAGCGLARERISVALDGELPWLAAQRLRAHLVGCSSCRGYRGELRSLTTVLRNEHRPRRLAVVRPRTLVALPVPVAVAAAALLVVGLPHQRHHPAYPGGALPATQGLPSYDTSVSRISQLLH